MRKYSKFLAGAVAATGLLSALPSAQAGLVFDLRFSDGSDSKLAAVGTYTVDLYAVVTDGNANIADDGFRTAWVAIESVQVSGGTVSSGGFTAASLVSPYAGAGTRVGAATSITADGITDWGSSSTNQTNTNYMFARADAMNFTETGTTNTPSSGVEFKLASFTFSITGINGAPSLGSATRLTFNTPDFVGTALQSGAAVYANDGTNPVTLANNAGTVAGVYGTYVEFTLPAGTPKFNIESPASLTLNTLQGAAGISGNLTVKNNGDASGDTTLAIQGAANPLSLSNGTATGVAAGANVAPSPSISLATGNYADGSRTVAITQNASDTGTTSIAVNYNVGRATASNNGDGTFGANALSGNSAGTGLSSRVLNGTENSNAEVTSLDVGSAVSMNWRLADATDLAPLFSDVVFVDALGADQIYDLKIYYADDYNGIENDLFLGRRNNDGTYNAAGGINVNTNDVVIDGISYGGYVWATALSGDGTFAVIPEPTSLALLGLGAAGLLARRRKA